MSRGYDSDDCAQHGIDTLPSELSDRLAELPSYAYERFLEPPVEGTSQSELFWAACELTREGFTQEDQGVILRGWFSDYYRPIEDREFARAVASAERKLREGGDSGESSAPRWPDPDAERIREITANPSGAEEELRRSSPLQGVDLWPTGQVIDRLFATTDLVCFGTAKRGATTCPRESFRGREAVFPLIVPNAMSARTGIKTDGGTSERCLGNVGPVIYQVIEFDQATRDEQARTLLHLGTMVPLRMVVFSGGKSLHGWFDVRTIDDHTLDDFRCYAASLGADPSMFVPCQFTRTPNAKRENGNQQSVLFLT